MTKPVKTMLTIFLDIELKKRLTEIAEIEDEVNATAERNRVGVSGLIEPLLAEFVENYHDDLTDWTRERAAYSVEAPIKLTFFEDAA